MHKTSVIISIDSVYVRFWYVIYKTILCGTRPTSITYTGCIAMLFKYFIIIDPSVKCMFVHYYYKFIVLLLRHAFSIYKIIIIQ